MKKFLFKYLLLIIVSFCGKTLSAQQSNNDTLLVNASLNACLHYAMQNQPLIQQSLVDERVTEKLINSNLAAWYPQIRTEYNLQHYFKTPVSLVPTTSDPNGPRRAQSFVLPNVSNWLFQADQVLFNSDVLLASRAAGVSRRQADQNTESIKIDIVVNVTKAFYDVLLTQQQLVIFDEIIRRQKKLLDDSRNQYEAGLVDKLDYKRTSIALNNTFTDQKRVVESIQAKYVLLKQLMGYPPGKEISIVLDTAKVKQDLQIDTNQVLKVQNRIEYQLQQSQRQLQKLNVSYYQWSALPTVSAFINYNFYYTSNQFSDLYKTNYPNSQGGVRVAMPLFQGTRRLQNLQRARLLVKRSDLGLTNLENTINTQYQSAVGSYKTSLQNLNSQEQNLLIAREVYDVVKLQYDNGIKPYIDVITAESDLRNSQVNYLNAVYNVLASKLDLQRALGTINTSAF